MGFPEDSVQAHNEHRTKHGVVKLKLNKEIVGIAQKWADHLASTGTFSHSKDRAYKGDRMGENIAMKWTSSGEDFTGQQVTDQWYSEVEKYDYAKSNPSGTGHFTQVVWKASQEFGIGKAKAADGKWIVVANYYPAGNVLGKFGDNVFAPGAAQKGAASKGKSERAKENQPPARQPDKMSGTSVSRSTRTEKCTEDRGQGVKTYVKTIVTETTIGPDGKKTVSTTETESTEGAGASGFSSTRSSDFDRKFKEMRLQNNPSGNNNVTYTTKSYSSQDDKKDKKEKEKKPQKIKDFIDEVVKTHNKYRKSHGKVGDLKHNKELSVLAQRWADHLAATKVLKHSDDTYKGQPLGENVASKWSSAGADYNGAEVAEQWYSENTKYDFARGQFMQGTGHFTQVVWKGSKEIGVGKALTSDGRVFVVCNYNPAGNVVGQFQDNVFRTK